MHVQTAVRDRHRQPSVVTDDRAAPSAEAASCFAPFLLPLEQPQVIKKLFSLIHLLLAANINFAALQLSVFAS